MAIRKEPAVPKKPEFSAAPDGGQPEGCPKCDHVHDPTKCQGHVIKDPDTRQPIAPRQCLKTPVKASTVCRSHGAARGTPAAAAAEQRQVEEKADKELAKLWPGLDQVAPVDDAYQTLQRLAGAMLVVSDELGKEVAALRHREAGDNLNQLRGVVTMWDKAVARLHGLLDSIGRLDVAGAHLALQEKEAKINRAIADQVIAAATGAWADLSRQRVDLLPEDRVVLMTGFIARLGSTATPVEPPLELEAGDHGAET